MPKISLKDRELLSIDLKLEKKTITEEEHAEFKREILLKYKIKQVKWE